ncbi:MAG: hypothetical protein IT440_01405 [Phycisphaeraceae bacterium]|nr:hypothetical protein [Phycisphaeraceae bacterium]
MLKSMVDMDAFPLSRRSANLLRFCRHADYDALHDEFQADFGYRYAGSRFSLLKNLHTAPGPDECFAHIDVHAVETFDKMLGLEWSYPDLSPAMAAKLCPFNTINYYRSHVEEFFCHNGVSPLPPVEGRCAMAFVEPDELRVAYALHNASRTEIRLGLRWYCEAHDTPRQSKIIPGGFEAVFEQKIVKPYPVYVQLRAETEGLSFRLDGKRWSSEPVTVTLVAGQTAEYVFRIRLDDRADFREPATKLGVQASFTRAVSQAEAIYRRLPPLEGAWARYEPLMLNAAGMMMHNTCQDRALNGRWTPTIRGGKSGLDATWFWDTGFYNIALGLLGMKEVGQGAMQLLLDGIDEQGMPSNTYQNGRYGEGKYQNPTLAWGLCQLDAWCPDEDFIRQALPPLERYVNHWLTAWDSGNGLVVFPPTGVSWDDALRWQDTFPIAFEPGETWHAKNWGRMNEPLFEQPDVNAHLALECRALAHLHCRLGEASQAAAWDQRANRLAERINALLWDEESGCYQDRCIRDGRFVKMLTPGSLWPIYAGMAPQPRAREMCRRFLLNPEHLYTPMPFASLDRSHPAFRSGGFLHAPPEHPGSLVQHAYWIGRSWPNMNFWMLGALSRAGLKNEADVAAERILQGMCRDEALNECYDPLTGTGNGHPECTHGAAGAIALAYRLYHRDPLGLPIG